MSVSRALWLLSAIVATSVCQQCFSSVTFGTSQGKITANGIALNIKGTNWFGFETSNQVVHGLWARDYKALLDFVATNGFNAIRLPLNLQLVLQDATPTSISFSGINLDLQGLSSLQILDKIVDASADRGLLILFDMHALTPDGFPGNGLWYDSGTPESSFIQGWLRLATRYGNRWNVLGADIKNEPYASTWGTGSQVTDFNLAVQRIGNQIIAAVPWLIFVEGTATSPNCVQNCFWGEDLQGAATTPVVLSQSNKLVYSPHCYGPSVFQQPYFSDPTFPNNMPAIWETHFGYLRSSSTPVVVGEWGGPYSGTTQVWLDAFVSYLISKDLRSTFHWALNPNSGDTGGILLDDWTTPDTAKLNNIARLQPSPSTFSKSGSNICINGGSSTVSSVTTTSTTTGPASATTTGQASTTGTLSTTSSQATTTAASVSSTTASATTSSTVGTTTSTTGTTSGTITGGNTGSYVIFFDSLNSAWTWSWSWQANNQITMQYAYDGSTAIMSQLQPWGGLQLGASIQGVTWQGIYTTFSFAIRSDHDSSNVDIWISGTSGRVTVMSKSSSWTHYSLSLANDLHAGTTVGNPGGIIFFNNAATNIVLYVDNILLQ